MFDDENGHLFSILQIVMKRKSTKRQFFKKSQIENSHSFGIFFKSLKRLFVDSATGASKKTRIQYPVEYKLFVLEEARQHSSRIAARTHNLADSVIRSWRRAEPKLREAYEKQKASGSVIYKVGSGPRRSTPTSNNIPEILESDKEPSENT